MTEEKKETSVDAITKQIEELEASLNWHKKFTKTTDGTTVSIKSLFTRIAELEKLLEEAGVKEEPRQKDPSVILQEKGFKPDSGHAD